MSNIEHQRKHFESISEKYFNARRHQNHLLLKKMLWNYFFIDKDACKKEVTSVLEPMCGYSEGWNIVKSWKSDVFYYDGFDYSENLVKKAKILNPDLNIFVQDVTTYQADRTYDMIIVIGGLHHVYQHVDISIHNLSRALRHGGYFINFEPTNNNPFFAWIRDKIYKKNHIFDDQTERAFELGNYNNLFAENGFELIDQLYPGLLSYVMYYNPDAFPLLNIGKEWLVRFLFSLDSCFFRNVIGRTLSFATLSIWRKTAR